MTSERLDWQSSQGDTMQGQRRKSRFWKRRKWGSVRAQLRSRFSKKNYEIEENHLKPYHEYSWDNFDLSRIRWKLKTKKPKLGIQYLEWWIGCLQGDTTELEKKYGIFFQRCLICNKKLLWNYQVTPHGFVCIRCK